MAKRYAGNYEGMSGKRTQEMQDAGMIRENPSAIANLPQEVMIKPWPDGGSYLPENLNDDISGINAQKNADSPVSKRGDNKGGFKPGHLN